MGSLLFIAIFLSVSEPALAQSGKDWAVMATSSFGGRDTVAACTYYNKMWVIGGSDGASHKNDVWSSPDGVNWTRVTAAAAFSQRVWHMAVAFQGKMWVIGGYNGPSRTYLNDVWSSTDGVTWTQVTAAAGFAPRSQFSCLVYNNKIWVIGGWNGAAFSDVWSTSDGVNWTRATNSAPFGPRAEHRSVVFGGKMWLVGGHAYGGIGIDAFNDAWWSTDGVAWTQATANAGFSQRFGHELFTDGVQMYLIGGCGGPDGVGLKNDVWATADGANWSQVTSAGLFTPRSMSRVLVFASRFWLLGGRIGNAFAVASDPVWFSSYTTPVALSQFAVE